MYIGIWPLNLQDKNTLNDIFIHKNPKENYPQRYFYLQKTSFSMGLSIRKKRVKGF